VPSHTIPPIYSRDAIAGHRDRAATKRDEAAERLDREADIADSTLLDLEGSDAGADVGTLRLRELCARGVEARKHAAHDRFLAKRDRRLAGIDREFGESNREDSRRDREHAATDGMTGALLRSVGLDELEREMQRARGTGRGLQVAYVDVQALRAVNDTHGRAAGDRLLQDVADGLRQDMRSFDLLVRLGGDEFLCVLAGVTADEARRRFEDLDSELPAGPTGSAVSVGLGELRDSDRPQDLVGRAMSGAAVERARDGWQPPRETDR
jgi:diguanylate cyclase (GGDEF)-like protein